MDPITLATITAGVSVLASECIKGMAGKAAEELWDKIKSLLGWKSQPKLDDIAPALAKQLSTDKELASRIVDLLQKDKSQASSSARALVGHVDAEKVVVSGEIHIAGDFNM